MSFHINSEHEKFQELYDIQYTIAAYKNPHMFQFDEFSQWSDEMLKDKIHKLEERFNQIVSSIVN